MTFSNEGTDGGDAGSPAPARILVVDDEETIRTLLKQILTDEGHGQGHESQSAWR